MTNSSIAPPYLFSIMQSQWPSFFAPLPYVLPAVGGSDESNISPWNTCGCFDMNKRGKKEKKRD